MPAVEVRGVALTYRRGEPNAVKALDGFGLEVHSGEFVALLGPSGSGKTTLLHVLALLLRPTEGQVLIDGVETNALSDRQRTGLRGRRIGLVLRDRSLLPGLTVLENVTLPLRYAGIAPGGRKRALELLEQVGLGGCLRLRPAELTAAQAQRAAVARALIAAPSVVLADEPTGELDVEASDELLFLLQGLNRTRGVTFIVATHDPDVASCLDRVVRMRDGQLVSDDLSRQPQKVPLPRLR